MAHHVGNAVDDAYWRNDPMVVKRRALQQAWSDFVVDNVQAKAKVIKFKRPATA
jgi:hypothetical protein